MLLNSNVNAQKIKYQSKVEKMIATDNWETIKKYASKSIDSKDKVGNTALMWAVIYDKLDIVDFLLEKKANPDIGFLFGEAGKKYLIGQNIENVDYYNTPLILAAKHDIDKQPNMLKIMKSLLDAGANPNAFDNNYESAVLVGIYESYECVKLLLEKGANIHYEKAYISQSNVSVDIYERFYSAIRYGAKVEMIDLLIEHGLNPDELITGCIVGYLLLEHRNKYYDSNHFKRHIKLITHILDKNYDKISNSEFLSLIEYSIYIPGFVPNSFGYADKERMSWFIDFFNVLWKHNGDELIKVFEDGTYSSKVALSAQKEQGSSGSDNYRIFLSELNIHLLARDKEWLDEFGYIIE